MEKQLTQVVEFMTTFGEPMYATPTMPPLEKQVLRANLIAEEARETVEAIAEGNIVKIADGCADLIYVVLGTVLTFGIPLEAVFDEVHRSNMTKVGGPRDPKTGKVLKPEGYTPPAIGQVLMKHGLGASQLVAEGAV